MKNNTPQEFEARVYNTPKGKSFVALTYKASNGLKVQQVSFPQGKHLKEVKMEGQEYFVTLHTRNGQPRVQVIEDNFLSVENCKVTLKKRKSVSL
jgi:hypothetical protein